MPKTKTTRQAIAQLGKEMDPILHNILRDRLGKYLGGHGQTRYDKDSLVNSDKHLQLQKNQKEIGWDNIVRGKYSKHWRIIQHDFTKRNKDNKKLKEMKKECKQTTELPKKKKTIKQNEKQIYFNVYLTLSPTLSVNYGLKET